MLKIVPNRVFKVEGKKHLLTCINPTPTEKVCDTDMLGMNKCRVKKCDEDKCNSALSGAVSAVMLLAAVFYTLC